MKIFISYSTEDEQIVRGLEQYISKEMIETWIDHKAVVGGSDLSRAIKKGINRADICFLFISQSSLDSKWVDKEIKWAKQKEEKLKYEFIVPIILESKALDKWNKKKLKDRKYISYNGDFHKMAHEIKNTLINKTIEKFEHQCLLKKDVLNNIASAILTIILSIAFFTTPSQKEHIESLQSYSRTCTNTQIKFEDVWFVSYATCPINQNKEFFSLGILDMIFTRENQNR